MEDVSCPGGATYKTFYLTLRYSITMKSLIYAMIFSGLFALVIFTAVEGRERHAGSPKNAGYSRGSQGPEIEITELEKKVHDLINRERRKKGLSTLAWDESLHHIARRYSSDMSERGFFSHNDPEGRCFMDRYKAGGFECRLRFGNKTCLGAENIAQENLYKSVLYRNGVPSYAWNSVDEIAASVVDLWMKSKGHRENILTPYFKCQGIGIAFSEDGRVYVTENFC